MSVDIFAFHRTTNSTARNQFKSAWEEVVARDGQYEFLATELANFGVVRPAIDSAGFVEGKLSAPRSHRETKNKYERGRNADDFGFEVRGGRAEDLVWLIFLFINVIRLEIFGARSTHAPP